MFKKTLFILILFIFVSLNAYANELLFECENGFLYEINNTGDSFYKNINQDWKKIDKVLILKNKYKLLIPNSTYQSCSNKDLPICYYSTVISYQNDKNKVYVSEIIQNDCFIGTMGCNNYSKGLELNQKRCKVDIK